MLEVRNLVVDHGPLRALWDVSLTVEAGERVGLLGANGAGKSTTLGAIIGMYRPAGGTVLYEGADITGRPVVSNIAAGLALVPEGRHLFTEMSVRENLEMGAYARSARARVAENLERIYELFPILRDKRSQRAGELSGGQQQMVAIGRCLMSSPRMLLLDEPFLGVAPVIIEEVTAALRTLSDEGVTVLLVEQNIHRAMEFVRRDADPCIDPPGQNVRDALEAGSIGKAAAAELVNFPAMIRHGRNCLLGPRHKAANDSGSLQRRRQF